MKKALLLLLLALTSCAKRTTQDDMTCYSRPQMPPVLIVLDAGHGGHDPGAIGVDTKAQEKDLALQTTTLTKRHLERMGYQVHLTRSGDTFIPLKERAAIANRLEAALFVSIHYNAAKNKEAKGVEVYHYLSSEETERDPPSKQAAQLVLERVIRYTHAPSRGVKKANYAVLRHTTMPALLIEGGFVSNPEELARLKDPKYLNAIAWGISQGINEYFLEKYRPHYCSH
ncbi:MAG: N-acetylmuramoyl-L-alanine amidase [Verrucomicrobia bacterium]|nr:N-acetylmuramoyl-L-alanine amidase [Verrucomicrobiota bacterium]